MWERAFDLVAAMMEGDHAPYRNAASAGPLVPSVTGEQLSAAVGAGSGHGECGVASVGSDVYQAVDVGGSGASVMGDASSLADVDATASAVMGLEPSVVVGSGEDSEDRRAVRKLAV